PASSHPSPIRLLARSPFRPLFFLMIPPPPPSTLFPYTTLFRSDLLADISVQLAVGGLFLGQGDQVAAQVNSVLVALLGQGAIQEDRKSTRLNSSHVSISYAVFCLKKKNRSDGTSPCQRLEPAAD